MPALVRRAAFILIILAALAAGLVLSQQRTGAAGEFAAIVRSEDFQAGLRYQRAGEGCVALTAMEDVDVIIIGSSQAFAGIDAVTLARRFAPQTTAVCALPAWAVGHFDLFVAFLEAQRLTPRRIIWIADAMAILETSASQDWLTQARQVFESRDVQAGVRGQWSASIERSGAPFPIDSAERLSRLDRQREGIARLSVSNMEAVLASREMASMAFLANYLETARPYPRREQRLAQVCAALDQRGVALDIVVGPVPDQTIAHMQALPNPALTPTLDDLGAQLKDLTPCARRVIARRAGDWGLDLRHYVNRMARPGYPYEIWDSPEAFAAHADGLDRSAHINLFDGNHLNLAGAVIFTEALAEAVN